MRAICIRHFNLLYVNGDKFCNIHSAAIMIFKFITTYFFLWFFLRRLSSWEEVSVKTLSYHD